MTQNTEQLTTEQILLNLLAYLHTSQKKIPIVGKVVLADDVASFAQQALQQYGDDLKEADDIIQNSDKIMQQTNEERNLILMELQHTIETTDIAQAANEYCEKKLQETEETCNRRLEETEIEIAGFLAEAQETRQQMMMDAHLYIAEVVQILENHLGEHEKTLKSLVSDVQTYQQTHSSRLEEKLHSIEVKEHSFSL